jgi:hypothetical protein
MSRHHCLARWSCRRPLWDGFKLHSERGFQILCLRPTGIILFVFLRRNVLRAHPVPLRLLATVFIVALAFTSGYLG